MSHYILPEIFGNETLFGVPLWDWAGAALLACVSFLVMLVVLRFGMARVNAIAQRKQTKFSQNMAEVLSATSRLLLFFASALLGAGVLNLANRWSAAMSHLWFILLALQTGLWLNRMASVWKRDHLLERRGANLVIATLMTSLMHVVVWAIVLLAILENAGVNITTLVASLGVGGVAIALALQTILGDMFAAIAIAVDKPFQVGDSISAGDISGTVERIGMKSTHIRSLGGEQIICSNTELLKRTIQNFKRMSSRRVVFRLNLSYFTPASIAEKIPSLIKETVEKSQGLRFGRAHLVKLGAASLEYEVVYTVLDADYDRYMNIQQEINVGLLKCMAAIGADLALPDGTRATAVTHEAAANAKDQPRQTRNLMMN